MDSQKLLKSGILACLYKGDRFPQAFLKKSPRLQKFLIGGVGLCVRRGCVPPHPSMPQGALTPSPSQGEGFSVRSLTGLVDFGLVCANGLVFPGDHTKLLATSDTAYKGFGNACANGIVFSAGASPALPGLCERTPRTRYPISHDPRNPHRIAFRRTVRCLTRPINV